MKQYLLDFMTSCNYDDGDIAFLLAAYNKIEADEESFALLNSIIEGYEKEINIKYDDFAKITEKIADKLYMREYTVDLVALLCLTKHLRELYIERGIDVKIFENSVLDLKYKLEECKLVKGVVGTFVTGWFMRFYNLTRFALGRLQFEIEPFDFNYSKNGVTLTPETRVINIHIPRDGTPMDEARCDESIAMAKEVFGDLADKPCAFVCHSWLLYPENETLLSERSNTYKFMKRFEIIDSGIFKDNGDLWRLFDTDEKVPDKLPADSSFRRAYVEHLKRGGKTGWGYGIFFL